MKSSPKEVEITLDQMFIGKEYYGSYDKTPEYLEDLKRELDRHGILYKKFETISIYYSDPSLEHPDKLKSFHGIASGVIDELPTGVLSYHFLNGHYVTGSTNDPETIWKLFEDVYRYVAQNDIKLTSEPPVLVSKMIDGVVAHTIYVSRLV